MAMAVMLLAVVFWLGVGITNVYLAFGAAGHSKQARYNLQVLFGLLIIAAISYEFGLFMAHH